jgi:hypothetical protein
MSDKLLSKIRALEAKINHDNHDVEANKKLLKRQITNPVVMPFVLIGSLAIGILIVRKKRDKHWFAYLSSLTFAASRIYKNVKFVMRTVNHFHPQKTIPGNNETREE